MFLMQKNNYGITVLVSQDKRSPNFFVKNLETEIEC